MQTEQIAALQGQGADLKVAAHQAFDLVFHLQLGAGAKHGDLQALAFDLDVGETLVERVLRQQILGEQPGNRQPTAVGDG